MASDSQAVGHLPAVMNCGLSPCRSALARGHRRENLTIRPASTFDRMSALQAHPLLNAASLGGPNRQLISNAP